MDKEKFRIPLNLQFFASDDDDADIDDDQKDDKAGDADKGQNDDQQDDDSKDDKDKYYSQEQVDKAVADAVAKMKIDMDKQFDTKLADELKEAERLAKLSKDDREKALLNKEKQRIADKEKELLVRELAIEKGKIFVEKSLPIELVDFVPGDNAEDIKKNIDSFAKVWQEAIKKGVDEKLKGTKTPKDTSDKKDDIDGIDDAKKRNLKSSSRYDSFWG